MAGDKQNKYREYKQLDLPRTAAEVLNSWEKEKVFEQSVANREGATPFVFYEGPPSANGMPGIHHVMARTIKDIFCRYQTLAGKQVKRKAGWDTHGLPIELAVEKTLGITKEDIGKKISVEDYNNACRREVMKYTDKWEELTKKMGYWVDMKHPYITYENTYIESAWYLLKELNKKGFMYKGYTIQPYSPAAGTGLSSAELNQPGCYREVTDTTVIAQFKAIRDEKSEFLFEDTHGDVFFLAWTTTPWTLPSNTALAVGKNITYVAVKTINQYTFKPIIVVLAKELFSKYFETEVSANELLVGNFREVRAGFPFESPENALDNALLKELPKELIHKGRLSHWKIIGEFKGELLAGIRYEQLLPYAQPDPSLDGEPFRVIIGDFVTTSDGTGIVHIAPTFGADDFRAARQNNVPAMLVKDEEGNLSPLVDKQGRFVKQVTDFAGEYVKEDYLNDVQKAEQLKIQQEKWKPIISKLEKYMSVDERIALMLKIDNKAFKIEKYKHTYPHCWRTDKPVLYYPLDSWFIKTTAAKDRLIALNKTINWKPEHTGTGRFGEWLNNLQDWNLSRSRFWGIPLPVWRTEDATEETWIGSLEELKAEIDKSVKAGFMKSNPLEKFKPGDFSKENYESFDVHKPYIDDVILVSASGKKMQRESDLIDVWFDSGSMPYAQLHYPFENKELIDQRKYYPADFIAEGVDQTRGWFFTLHAIAVMVFDSVAYKNVVSNGLVLDKNGNKMSKRLGNAVDPFETLSKYGPDATRWYMITNAQPWDNLKFDIEGIVDVQRKFFGTLYNTYNFFALYANLDGFSYSEAEIPYEKRPEIDRWILSELNSLIRECNQFYSEYEPTKAGRAIEEFVDEHLSNWYVRLCRRRFWKGEYNEDKIAAYQTLYRCLEVISQIASPIAPFFMDRLFTDLNTVTDRQKAISVHLSDYPKHDDKLIDKKLEERMKLAQKISSMVLSLRKKQDLRVRQPLNKILVPVLDRNFREQLEAVKNLILAEVNVKEMEFLTDTEGMLVKKIKPNFKALGPKVGKHMKAVAAVVGQFTQQDIAKMEREGSYELSIDGEKIELTLADVEIMSEDIPGWLVASQGPLTVALDVTITDELRQEGIARELVNRIQNMRKDRDFEVTDRIAVRIQRNNVIDAAVNNNLNYICSETLASSLELVDEVKPEDGLLVEVDDDIKTFISIGKLN